MELVKKIKKDEFTLTHSCYVDDLGLKRNSFELFDELNRVIMPFWGNIRVGVSTATEQIFLDDDTSPYSDQEYESMLEEQIGKYKHYKR